MVVVFVVVAFYLALHCGCLEFLQPLLVLPFESPFELLLVVLVAFQLLKTLGNIFIELSFPLQGGI